jgi:hypothetical protein
MSCCSCTIANAEARAHRALTESKAIRKFENFERKWLYDNENEK